MKLVTPARKTSKSGYGFVRGAYGPAGGDDLMLPSGVERSKGLSERSRLLLEVVRQNPDATNDEEMAAAYKRHYGTPGTIGYLSLGDSDRRRSIKYSRKMAITDRTRLAEELRLLLDADNLPKENDE